MSRLGSSVAEHVLGKYGVVSSILTSGSNNEASIPERVEAVLLFDSQLISFSD